MNIRSLGIKLRLSAKKLLLDIRHTHLKDLRNWFLYSLKKLPDIVHLKNLVLFTGVISIIILVLFVDRYDKLSQFINVEKPDYGGSVSLGVTGNIDQINPLFTSDEAEKAAVKLVFSGLTRIDDTGKAVPDLATSWRVDSTGKIYDFTLRKGIKWHDGSAFSADEVIFTIDTIQNQDTRTDLYNIWQGVKVEKVSDNQIRFTLTDNYPDFPKVAAEPILAKHVFAKTEPKNIKISEDNNHPIGTGPYKFVRFDQLGAQPEAVFVRNDNFALGKPYLENVRIVSYPDEASTFDGLNRKQVDGVFSVDPSKFGSLTNLSGYAEQDRFLPQYEMMYINLRNSVLANLDLRKAIVQAVSRTVIMKDVVGSRGEAQWGPAVPGSFGYDSSAKQTSFNVDAAKTAIQALGYVKSKDGYYEKDGKVLDFKLVYPDTFQEDKVSSLIVGELKAAGIKVELKVVDPEQITSSYLKPRNFDMLVLPQNIGYGADWYSLWDSSQVNVPGMNLSGLSDKRLDKYVEQARRTADAKGKSDRLKLAAGVIIEQVPAVYLYRIENVALMNEKIHGVGQVKLTEPLDYLNSIYHWYTSTTTM